MLRVEDLAKSFEVWTPWLARLAGRGRSVPQAVDGVGFTIAGGETMSLIGGSGCGQSTVAWLSTVRTAAGW